MSAATYLYCIVQGSKKPSAARIPPGVPDGSPPQLREVSSTIWLVTSDVRLSIYGEDALEAGLANLDWVGRVALAHEHVVEQFARRDSLTVVPMKLFTLFSSGERAVAEIGKQRLQIARIVRRIAGAEEWGVRVVRNDRRPAPVAATGRSTSGVAFLTARKQARDAVRSTRAAGAEAASEAFARLSRVARDAVRRDGPPPAGATPPLLDAAFLVPVRSRTQFKTVARREAQACRAAGVELTLTGPWPAYHFVAGTHS